MGKHIIEGQYDELIQLTEILKRLVDSYRLLIGGAAELNTIYGRKKGDINDALDRVDDLGKIIDGFIDGIDKHDDKFLEYMKLKGEVLGKNYAKGHIEKEISDVIQTEINHELNFKNN
ncbi:MAG: hypothetical protein ACRC28_12615 [Clostridium sp.]|uniref:hypothetical protein n=1 Tax=Clostridium sp. TaxID=1506 RepID=UPI003F2AFAEC